MNLDYQFNPLACDELQEAVDFREAESEGTGLRLADAVEKAIMQLRTFPESGPLVVDDIRAKVISRYRYTVYYSVRPGHVRILAIASHHRQPFYWLGRQ